MSDPLTSFEVFARRERERRVPRWKRAAWALVRAAIFLAVLTVAALAVWAGVKKTA